METITRTIRIPVAEVINGSKKDFYADLRNSLKLAVTAANVCVNACVQQDDFAMEKAPKLYTYKSISKMFPGNTKVAASIARAVEKTYLSDRWKMARGMLSVRNHRSFPWILLCNKSSQSISVEDKGEFLVAEFKLHGEKWLVRLAGGSSYSTMVAGLRKAISIGDSKIWIDRKGKAVLGLCVKLPVTKDKPRSGTMQVSSSRDHLLVGSFARSDIPFVVNADVCKQWKAESNKRMQRLRQDRKSEANKKIVREQMRKMAIKNQNRFKTLCHEVASRIVNKANRMGVAEIKLDLTVKSYVDSFPWFDLQQKIKEKAERFGITLTDETTESKEADVKQPHVYFKYAPSTNRVKIGHTKRTDGLRHGTETDSSEELVILAIDNQPKAKVQAREKHWHSYFNHCRLKRQDSVTEWFDAEPIIAWLREASWLGNAGNVSQIMQVLDVSTDTVLAGYLQAQRECSHNGSLVTHSQNAVNVEDIALQKATALEVNEKTFCN